MSLSEQEQQLLREIEESLMAEDPKFGSSVYAVRDDNRAPSGGAPTMRSIAVMLLGLLLLIGGVALAAQSIWFVVLSLIGFGVMFAGGVWALKSPAAPKASPEAVTLKTQPKRTGMSSRMEENFRRRFDQQ